MPSFDSETTELWRRERVAKHCRKNSLISLVRKELRKLEKELMNGTAEDRAQWLLEQRWTWTEEKIVKQCANKLGEKWLEGRQTWIEQEEQARRRIVLEKTRRRINDL